MERILDLPPLDNSDLKFGIYAKRPGSELINPHWKRNSPKNTDKQYNPFNNLQYQENEQTFNKDFDYFKQNNVKFIFLITLEEEIRFFCKK